MMTEGFRRVALSGIIVISRHAEERRLKQGVLIDMIHSIVHDFDVIEDYPEAYPLPAKLLIGFWNQTPLHVVAGFDLDREIVYIITVYIPDSEHFEPDWRTRRRN